MRTGAHVTNQDSNKFLWRNRGIGVPWHGFEAMSSRGQGYVEVVGNRLQCPASWKHPLHGNDDETNSCFASIESFHFIARRSVDRGVK